MKIRISKETIRKIEAAVRRQEALDAGYYDGRNRNRVRPDKKKEENKKMCRGKSDFLD